VRNFGSKGKYREVQPTFTVFCSSNHLFGGKGVVTWHKQNLPRHCHHDNNCSVSVGFWRWCVSIERIVLLDFIHHLVSQKIEELKIYQISQDTRPQNSHKDQLLTTEPLTWVHTHINPWSKSDTGGNKWPSHCTLHSYWKSREHKYCIQTKAPTHPHTPWNTRSQGKTQVAISDTAICE
jgi:hypothetical protein